MFADRHIHHFNCTCCSIMHADRAGDIQWHLRFCIHFEIQTQTDTDTLTVCLRLCRCHSDALCFSVCLSHHTFTLSLVQQKANSSVNSGRHEAFTCNSLQIKTTEGGLAYAHCNTPAINHICFSLLFLSLLHTLLHHLQKQLPFYFIFSSMASWASLGIFWSKHDERKMECTVRGV